MHVVVLGAGSLGSLVGGLLARTDAAVTLLGREGEHVECVRSGGLQVAHPDGSESRVDVDIATEPSVASDANLVVVCVKSYDTFEAAASVAPHLDGADVLTLQNGLGNAETIAEHVPPERVVAGTTTHGALVESPGVVRHAGRGETTIGRYFADNDPFEEDDERLDKIAAVFTAAGVETVVTNDPENAMWKKVLVNAGINATTALARVPNGALVEHEAGDRLLERAVEESAAVARAEGVAVSPDAIDQAREVAVRTATNRSSMYQDLERGAYTEIEALNGEIARRADEHDIDAPVNQTLADLVRLCEGA